jgi:ubiquinone/menaquinone biosynthesis C-methylase UbiE
LKAKLSVKKSDEVINKIVAYYNDYDEAGRLSVSLGQIEYVMTQNIISRYLTPPPAIILDVGGAAGRYSCWLAQLGYEVHLIDPVPSHVDEAQSASDKQPETPIASCNIGDARNLDFDDEYADAILLLGPLYHLVEYQDRLRALSEAHRALKSNGYLFSVGISRFASTIDGLMTGNFRDPEFQKIIQGDLRDGRHRNPTDNLAYFMDTYFHHPKELQGEVAGAGFKVVGLLAIEGISYMMKDFEENWNDKGYRDYLIELLSKIEGELCLIGASPHIMCVGVKP